MIILLLVLSTRISFGDIDQVTMLIVLVNFNLFCDALLREGTKHLTENYFWTVGKNHVLVQPNDELLIIPYSAYQ